MTTNPRPQAVVTGASSGIGTAFAERLARDGYDLIMVARRRDRLETLAQSLQASHQVNVQVVAADLSKPDSLQTVEDLITQAETLEFLINNAGFGGYMSFIELEPEQAEAQINLHVVALTRLTRAALPGMLKHGRGAIVNVSSRLAFSASLGSTQLPKRATYVGTKAYINAFSQLLNSELEGTGVQVQALCPGLVETEFHSHVGADSSRFPAAMVMKPEDVVSASLAGLKLGEAICVPALEDLNLLTQIQESERKFFETSRMGSVAARYKS